MVGWPIVSELAKETDTLNVQKAGSNPLVTNFHSGLKSVKEDDDGTLTQP